MRLAIPVVIVALACASPAYPDTASSKEAPDMLRRLTPFLADYNALLLGGPPRDCTTFPPLPLIPTCVIEVAVWLVNSNGIDYCVTQFPAETTFNRLTRVVWKLKDHVLTSQTTGNTYNIAFHESYGILPYRDRFGQLLGGGIGDGTTANNWWYRRFNLYTDKDPAIVYVPLILQTLSTNDKIVGVCAVRDPRMVNT